MISTAGYIHDTGSLHVRQRPPSATQLRTGRLSIQLSIRPHEVQREPGCTTDMPSGNRYAQTLRKLPMHRPNSATVSSSSQAGVTRGLDYAGGTTVICD